MAYNLRNRNLGIQQAHIENDQNMAQQEFNTINRQRLLDTLQLYLASGGNIQQRRKLFHVLFKLFIHNMPRFHVRYVDRILEYTWWWDSLSKQRK
jgi:hypothetical protein